MQIYLDYIILFKYFISLGFWGFGAPESDIRGMRDMRRTTAIRDIREKSDKRDEGYER